VFHDFTYPAVLSAASRAAWKLDDVMPGDAALDFTRRFLPEPLARTDAAPGLRAEECLLLNQIRGHEYLSLFGLIEEFIFPFLLDHVREQGPGEDEIQIRALLQFAGEEAKHIQLFRRFQTAFRAGFATECQIIGPAEAIAAEVLRHHPLAVALVVLQIEWMTQSHYLDSVRDDDGIDPLFASLLRHHWMEEAQHAKLDTLMVEAVAADMTRDGVAAAIDDYFKIAAFLDAGLQSQVQFNLAAFEQAAGRSLDGTTRDAVLAGQLQALRWTYIGSGLEHRNFRTTLAALSPDGLARVDAAARAFR